MAAIAFQGERGAFSEIAAGKLCGRKARLLPCATFDAAFAAAASGRAVGCVVPLENSLAGSIHRNYDLLLRSRLSIAGEVNLRIVHNLIAPRSTPLSRVKRVLSHPVALAQCERFLRARRGLTPVPTYDTAGSLKIIREEQLRDAAAIAGAAAARAYGMRILKAGIEDDPRNFTRFVLLRRGSQPSPGADKTSIVFSTKNVPGGLFKCLAAFALRGIDLTKIESRPIPGRPWEYLFYVDFLGSPARADCERALDHLKELADLLRVLGSYKKAPLP